MHINLELDDRVTTRDEPVVSIRQNDCLVRLGTHDEIGSGGSSCRGLVDKIIGRRPFQLLFMKHTYSNGFMPLFL